MRRCPANDVCVLGVRHSNSRLHEAAVERCDLHVPQTVAVGLFSRLRVQQTVYFTSYCACATLLRAYAPVGRIQVIAGHVPCSAT